MYWHANQSGDVAIKDGGGGGECKALKLISPLLYVVVYSSPLPTYSFALPSKTFPKTQLLL